MRDSFFTLLCLLLALSGPLSAQVEFDDLTLVPLVEGLRFPVGVTHAGDGSGRLFIALQDGRILIHDGNALLPTPFLDVRDRVRCCGEIGLLGLAFHPDHENNGYFYVLYTDNSEPPGNSIVSRFEAPPEAPNVADPGSETILLTVPQPSVIHNGGQLQFGPEGYLYIALGDGGTGGDLDNNAQRLDTVLGAILRIDVDHGDPYSVPADNPFVGRPDAREEIWVYGLRNPWRFSFDRLSGEMFIGDVGQGGREEIDYVPAESPGGENFGWRRMEGNRCFDPPEPCESAGLTAPIFDYEHDPENIHPVIQQCSGSVIAGYRYRGTRFPQLQGVFFLGDFCTGIIAGLVQEEGQWRTLDSRKTERVITSFGEDEAGELYLTEWVPGNVYRLEISPPVPSLSVVSPEQAVAGGAEFHLTVQGSRFVPESEILWNGQPRPTSYIDPNHLYVTLFQEDVASEETAVIQVRNPEGGLSAEVEFPVRALEAAVPALNENGVVNSATFGPEPVVPGSIVSIFGTDLAATSEAAQAVPLPTLLGGATLWLNDTVAVPLVFASPQQVNAQIPWSLEVSQTATLTVRVGGQVSEVAAVPIASTAPGLYSVDQSGSGQGAILIGGSGGAIAGPRNLGSRYRPAGRGQFLEIFATGLGAVTNVPATGAPPGPELSQTVNTPSVAIGGQAAKVSFSGLAPGFAGLYQVNARVPQEAPSGEAVPVELTIGGMPSNQVTVAVD